MKIHHLKIDPSYFLDVKDGIKTFEIRFNDRNYEIDDILHLQEYDGFYTGNHCFVKVTYILFGQPYLNDCDVCMAIKLIDNY